MVYLVQNRLFDMETMSSGRCANATSKPIVFDPVGVGATTYRKQVANGSGHALHKLIS